MSESHDRASRVLRPHSPRRWPVAPWIILSVACGGPAAPHHSAQGPGAATSVDAGARPENPEARASDAGTAAAQPSAQASPQAGQPGALSVLYEGICSDVRPWEIGGQSAILFPHSVWMMGDVPRLLFRDTRPADMDYSMFELGTLFEAGGLDEGHAWIARTHRMTGNGSDILLKARNWEPIPMAGDAIMGYGGPIARSDGSLWLVTFTINSAGQPFRYFTAWSSEGKSQKANLPGSDMYLGKPMPSGEIVSDEVRKGKLMLLRWSPKRPVDDLVVDAGPFGAASAYEPFVMGMLIGSSRAFLLTPKEGRSRRIYFYDGEKISPSPLNATSGGLAELTSWIVTSTDDVWVTTSAGKLLFASKDGAVKEESLPEPGVLARTRAPWLLATSGALYARARDSWQRVTLWANDYRPAVKAPKVEWVKEVGQETLVGVVQMRPGFGRPVSGPVRTVYTTNASPAAVRCGAPFPTDTLAVLPRPAGDTCADPMVLASGVRPGGLPPSYPKLVDALKGLEGAGDSVTFVDFGSEGGTLLGIAASSLPAARAVQSRLSGKVAYPIEILCGTPKALRRQVLDLGRGAFRTQETP